MSRNGEKKPVGFAIHITAGGIAGAMEAVRVPGRSGSKGQCSRRRSLVVLPAAGHHQGAHAALQVWRRNRGTYPFDPGASCTLNRAPTW